MDLWMFKQVLIVEDDRDIREPMREFLFDEGYSIECASTGEDALHFLDQHPPPHIILCDLMMPKMNGIELIEHLREKNLAALEAVVILSAAAHAKKTADELGVGYLKKPIDIDHLLAMVKRYCEGKTPHAGARNPTA